MQPFHPAALAGVLLALVGLPAAAAAPACQLGEAAVLHVEMDRNSPLIQSEINGQKVFLLADTGAVAQTILRAQAVRLGLKGVQLNGELHGVGGGSAVSLGVIDELKLDKIVAKKVDVLIGGEAKSMGRPDLVGVIGGSLFSKYDVEFDLADGVIRLFVPKDCKNAELAYWGTSYSVAPLKAYSAGFPRFETEVLLNGKRVTAMIDSGSPTSVATLVSSSNAGITPRSPGVVAVEDIGGFGANRVSTWIAKFDTFTIGDETIKNAKLRIADLFKYNVYTETASHVDHRISDMPGMLLGADFLKSHRVLISNSQHRVYFSYRGGPVFDTAGAPAEARAGP